LLLSNVICERAHYRLGPPSPAMQERGFTVAIEQPLARIAGEGTERSEAGEGTGYQALGSHHYL